MKILTQLMAMLSVCKLWALTSSSMRKDQTEVYKSLILQTNKKGRHHQKRMADESITVTARRYFRRNNVINDAPLKSIIVLTGRDEKKMLVSKLGVARKNRGRHDIGNASAELNDSRSLLVEERSGSGKGGRSKGVTNNDLDICLNRPYKNSVATTRGRLLHSLTGYENEPHTKGKGGSMGSMRKYSKCATSEKRGKGGSSKSKMPKGKTSNVCADYRFPTKSRKEQRYRHESEKLLDVARGIPRLSIFVNLVEKTSLAAILDCSGPFTVLIPANRAFRTLDPAVFADILLRDKSGKLDDILLSHIVPGRVLSNKFQNGSLKALNGNTLKITTNPLIFNKNVTIGTRDIIAANGVIHIIDSVLFTNVSLPICETGVFDFEGPTCGSGCTKNLIDLACEQPQLSTFLSLVQLSGLEEIFECKGPFTLFIPHNDAFDDLRSHFWLELLKPQKLNDLKDFILYHILPGSLLQAELKLLTGATSLFLDKNITISRNPLMINGAQVVARDLLACNGVLHIIDKVLEQNSPPSITVHPTLKPSIKAVSLDPTTVPILGPSITPTVIPSIIPSGTPPSAAPSKAPTSPPTNRPSDGPTLHPTKNPSLQPSAAPTAESEPPTILPSATPSSSPSASPSVGIVRININRRIYFAYVSESNEEPTESQYNEAQRITLEYYEQYIRNTLMVTRPLIEFLGWNVTLIDTRFNAGIPLQRFNIYMEYAMVEAIYSKESRNVPSPGEFLNFLKDGYVIEYLLNITSLTGTPFEMVTEGVFSTI